MNVFIMILVFVLMAGYYLIDSPSQRVADNTIDSALQTTEVKSVLSCMVRAHAAAANRDAAGRAEANEVLEADGEPCAEKYNVRSIKLCTDGRREVSACVPERAGKTIGNFVITTADIPDGKNANLVLKILAQDYEAAPNFGIAVKLESKSFAILSGNGHRRSVPGGIASAADLRDGGLVYVTQYSASADADLGGALEGSENIICSFGEQKIFRFNKWECVPQNPPAVCTGDTIWKSSTGTCEIDPSRRPLCEDGQTAVEVEDMWQCIEPSPMRECPNGMIAHLDYSTMEWFCVESTPEQTTKCQGAIIDKGRLLGGTLLKPGNLCNDCEKMILNEEPCAVACIPDPGKNTVSSCYPRAAECRGDARAFYFGFPNNSAYLESARANLPELSGVKIPMDGSHSQNRRFNCLDCGDGGRIDQELSLHPFVAVCEE